MKNVLRLAFVLPALLAAAPAIAESAPKPAKTIRYVTLDKLLKKFAAEARAEQTARSEPKPATVVAQR